MPIIYATSLLTPHVGFMGNALFYFVTIPSALFFAVPASDWLGLKWALVSSMLLYTAYVFLFALAMNCQPGAQMILYCCACCAGGCGGGLLWVAQGTWFTRTASLMAGDDVGRRPTETVKLSGEFAFWYLVFEVVAKAGFSCLDLAGILRQSIAFIYAFISLVAAWAMGRADEVDWREDSIRLTPKGDVWSTMFTTIRLWPDPRVWLLSTTNIAFGFSGAFMNGYFNSTVATTALGAQYIGFLTSFTVLSAALCTKIYTALAVTSGPSIPLIAGAISFATIAILFRSFELELPTWHWGVLVFYALQGSGRAVYESTNRAAFSQFFTGKDTEAAFANCFLQMALSGGLSFLLSGLLSPETLATIVLVAALLTPGAYVCACKVNDHVRVGEEKRLIASA